MNYNTIKRLQFLAKALLLIALALLMNACFLLFQDIEDPVEKTANQYIYEYFQEWYLWYDQLPDINPDDFDSYSALVDTLEVDQDRWSFAASLEVINKLLNSGESEGFGAGFIIDFDNQIKITHVYDDSPMGEAGVQRGWTVNSVNGFTIDNLDSIFSALNASGTTNFVFTDHEGSEVAASVEKADFTINTVLHHEIIEKEEHKVAYIVFNSFLNISEDELIPVFENFKEKNITNLIVDLRYNGGGVSSVAELFIGIIGGEKVVGQTIATTTHNDKKMAYNEPTISNHNGVKLDLERVHFITTDETASASEMVINSLSPFMEVSLVGSPTHGKPVGMYVFSEEALDLAILPISFKTVNSEGYGEFFDGLPVDIAEYDDVSRNWGDQDEAMLAAALQHIINPDAVAISSLKSERIEQQHLFPYKGIKQLIKAY